MLNFLAYLWIYFFILWNLQVKGGFNFIETNNQFFIRVLIPNNFLMWLKNSALSINKIRNEEEIFKKRSLLKRLCASHYYIYKETSYYLVKKKLHKNHLAFLPFPLTLLSFILLSVCQSSSLLRRGRFFPLQGMNFFTS